jgi:two-component system nitrate/nitrite response regulator NarL
MADLRLLIVSADPLARAGLATLLADQPGSEVIGQVAAGEDLAAALEVYQPEVIIWDLGWEPEEELVLLGELALDESDAGPGIVVLLPDPDQAPVAWSAGARGLLPRDTSGDGLWAAAEAVARGLAAIDPAYLEGFLPARALDEPGPVEELTPRELEVLALLAEGLANKAIAQRLEISEHTVKFHVNALMGKLSAQSRTEAVVRATRLGLISL